MIPLSPPPTFFPYTTLFRSNQAVDGFTATRGNPRGFLNYGTSFTAFSNSGTRAGYLRSEEHTSELQSHVKLVCRLLLEKNNLFPAGTLMELGVSHCSLTSQT